MQHRDDSKGGDLQGRTGMRGKRPMVSGDFEQGHAPTRGGKGMTRVRAEEDLPAEDRTFSQSGGTGSQPGLAKRLATDEEEDYGHFDRRHTGRETGGDESKRSRTEGAIKHGARPK